jgi:hypothetical protein
MKGTLARFTLFSVWLGLMVLLWQGSVETDPVGDSAVVPETGAEALQQGWMGLYMGEKKVGYSNFRIRERPGGFTLLDRSVLRLRMLDSNQTVTAHSTAETDDDFALQSFHMRLQSGVGNFQVSGEVAEDALVVTTEVGKQIDTLRFPIEGPVYLPSALRAHLVASGLEVGTRRESSVFDPAAMAATPIVQTVVAREMLESHGGPVEAWKVVESFRGIETTVWVDGAGTVLREQGPMGMVAVRESADRATGAGWGDGSLVDLMDAVAVPVEPPIEHPRELSRLSLRVGGLGDLRPPSDARQRFADTTLAIEREELAAEATFELPYRGDDRAVDLAATAFVQSEHPRLKETAARILDGETDARTAAVRLERWVYGNLRKKAVASIPNALQVLEMGEGDCNEHAVLFAGLARAAGLPARVVAGVVYSDGVFLYHAWNEVWLGDRWISVDAAFNQMPVDATHVKLIEGEPDRHIELVPVIGKLSLEVVGAG